MEAPIDMPYGIADGSGFTADGSDETGYDENIPEPVAPTVEIDGSELSESFKKVGSGIGRYAISEKLRQSTNETDMDFGTGKCKKVQFTVSDNENNRKSGYGAFFDVPLVAMIVPTADEELNSLKDIWEKESKGGLEQSRTISAKVREILKDSKQSKKWGEHSAHTVGVVPPIPGTNFNTIIIGIDRDTYRNITLDGVPLIGESAPKSQ